VKQVYFSSHDRIVKMYITTDMEYSLVYLNNEKQLLTISDAPVASKSLPTPFPSVS